MGKIADSIKENLEHILKELPEQLHDQVKSEIENTPDLVHLSGEEELSAIKRELAYNPDIDESVVSEIDLSGHRPIAPPSPEEEKALIAEALKNPPTVEASE